MNSQTARVLCTLLLALGACGDDSSSSGSEEPIAGTPVTPGPLNVDDIVSVETLLPVSEMVAGDSVNVTCLANDSEGRQGPVEGFIVEVTPTEGVTITGATVQCTLVGEVAVACVLGALKDETPAPLTVRAGPPAVSSATVTPEVTQPEEVAAVACSVQDAYGNPVEGVDMTIEVAPTPSIVIDGKNVSGTAMGEYEVSCTGAGIESALAASWTIESGPAVTFALATIPDVPAHKVNSGIQVIGVGEDAWDNPVTGLEIVNLTASPEGGYTLLGDTQTTISFAEEGFYTLTAELAEDPTRSASMEIVVDQTGPQIVITSLSLIHI